jgi:hypothetical protein
MEGVSGRPLGWFFDQWLRRPGYAELTTSWRYDAAQRRVVATIAQAGRFGVYRFPLTVAISIPTCACSAYFRHGEAEKLGNDTRVGATDAAA